MTIQQINSIGICFMFLGLFSTFAFALYMVKKSNTKR